MVAIERGDRGRAGAAALIFAFSILGHEASAQSETPPDAEPRETTSDVLSLDACQTRLGGYELILENERSLRVAAQEQAIAAQRAADAASSRCTQSGGEGRATEDTDGAEASASAAGRLARTLDDLENAIRALSAASLP